MGKFTKISQDAFEGMQLDAGVLLRSFDPAHPAEPADADIICATTGGINATCVPTYSDLGEDIDNVPNNMMEFKHLDSWECKLAFNALSTTPSGIKTSLGCADIDNSSTPTKIVPRADLKQSDFEDALWWVGDKTDGGFVAVKLMHALSDSGFSLQTTKNGKGQLSCSLTGHVSIKKQKVVPMEFYSIDAEDEGLYAYLNETKLALKEGDTFTLEATTTEGATVAFASTDTSVATVGASTGLVTAVDAGACVITATATKDGDTAIATCVVNVSENEDAEG